MSTPTPSPDNGPTEKSTPAPPPAIPTKTRPASPAVPPWVFGTVGVILIAAILIVINVLATFNRGNIDTTEHKIHTFTEGSRKTLASVSDSVGNGKDAKVNIKVFVSPDDELPAELRPELRELLNMLELIKTQAGSAITYSVLRPSPDTDDGDAAKAASIEPRNITRERAKFQSPIFFGLSATCLDKSSSIDFLPEIQRPLWEDKLVRMISRVAPIEKRVLGVMSALPLSGDEWTVYKELQADFEVVDFDPTTTEEIIHKKTKNNVEARIVPEGLIIIHPAGISDLAQWAVNEYIQQGGKVAAFLDPMALSVGQPNPARGGGTAPSSDLSKLLPAWGYSFSGGGVDPAMAMFGGGGGALAVYDPNSVNGDFLVPLFITPDSSEEAKSINKNVDVMENLQVFLLPVVGSFNGRPASGLTEEMLISTSPNSIVLESSLIQSDPRQFEGVASVGGANELSADDIADIGTALDKLKGTDPAAAALWNQIPEATRTTLINQRRPEQIKALIDALNSLINKTETPAAGQRAQPICLYGQAFTGVNMDEFTRQLAAGFANGQLPPAYIPILNRQLVLDTLAPGLQKRLRPRTLALKLSGKFPHAFPDGKPAPPPPPQNPGGPGGGIPMGPPGAPGAEGTPGPDAAAPVVPTPDAPEPPVGPPTSAVVEAPAEPAPPSPETPAPVTPAPDAPAPTTATSPPVAIPGPTDPAAPPVTAPTTPHPPTPNPVPPPPPPGKDAVVYLIGDVDMIWDRACIGAPGRGGRGFSNSNGPLLLNIVDEFMGDLSALQARARTSFDRPFTSLNKMLDEATREETKRDAEIQAEIEKAKAENTKKLENATPGSVIFLGLSKESEDKIRALEREQSAISRKARKETQKLTAGIQAWNLLAAPALLFFAGLIVTILRKTQTSAR